MNDSRLFLYPVLPFWSSVSRVLCSLCNLCNFPAPQFAPWSANESTNSGSPPGLNATMGGDFHVHATAALSCVPVLWESTMDNGGAGV